MGCPYSGRPHATVMQFFVLGDPAYENQINKERGSFLCVLSRRIKGQANVLNAERLLAFIKTS